MTDLNLFNEIVGYCNSLKTTRGDYIAMCQGIEDIIFMRDSDEQKRMKAVNKSVATVIDPSDRVAFKGALRILSVNVPQVNVPFDKNDQVAKAGSEKIESACNALLALNDRYAAKSLHNEVLFSLLGFDESVAGVHSTKDMLAQAQETLDDATELREKAVAQQNVDFYKKLSKETPFLYPTYHPMSCFPDMNRMIGLRSLYIETETTIGEVLDTYGSKARRMLSASINPDSKRLDPCKLGMYIDSVYIATYIVGYTEPFKCEAHGLPFLNYVLGRAEGSYLMSNQDEQHEPLLFTEYKSELYKRRNIILSAWFTNVQAVGLSPTWDWQHPENPGLDRPEIVSDDGIISYWDSTGGRMVPIKDRTLIDPGLKEAYDITRNLGEKSTINDAALGMFMGSATNYSLQALLSTLGKLPLEPVRNAAGRLIADLLELSLRWWKAEGGKYKLYNNRKGVMAELKSDEIPDNITLETVLDASLSQDMLQQASVFAQLDGKLSQRFLAEKVMKTGQWDEMQKEIWGEQASKAYFMNYIQNELTQKVQKIIESVNAIGQQPQGGAPGQQGEMQQPMPEEQMMEQAPGGQQIPREMAMGGNQGPVNPMGQGGYPSDNLP